MTYPSTCLCDNRPHDFIPVITYAHETTFAAYDGTVIARCPRCNVLKTFPPEDAKGFDPLVQKFDTYEGRYKEFYGMFEQMGNLISRHMSPPGTVLDIGCSVGIFLKVMQDKGYAVSGIEPIRQAASLARKRTGTTIFDGALAEYLKEKRTPVDCILLNHVMEHMTDPGSEIARIRKLLKPGGYLFVGVPSRDNVIFGIRGKYWEYLLPGEHVWHFARRDIRDLLKKNGFEIIDTLATSDARRGYPFLKRIYFSLLTSCNAILGMGESYMVLARKQPQRSP